MSQKFIEVTTDHPSTGETYKLLLQLEQVVQIRPEMKVESEPQHDPVAVVVMTSGETLVLKNSYMNLLHQLDEVNMLVRS